VPEHCAKLVRAHQLIALQHRDRARCTRPNAAHDEEDKACESADNATAMRAETLSTP